MSNDAELNIVNNKAENRFEVKVGDEIAFAEYQLAGKNIIFTHTEVPTALEGQGIGSRLARFGLDYAKGQGYKVQALCPFINSYVSKHDEYHSITWGY